jgi:hypothetical protein
LCAEAFELGRELREVSSQRSKTIVQQQGLAVQHSETIDALTDVFENIWGRRNFEDVQAASPHLLTAVDLEAELFRVEKRKQAILHVKASQTETHRYTADLSTAAQLLSQKIQEVSQQAYKDLAVAQQQSVEDCRALELDLDSQLAKYKSLEAGAAAAARKATVEGQLGWVMQEAESILETECSELQRYAEVRPTQKQTKQLEQYCKTEVNSLTAQVSTLKTDLIRKSKQRPELTENQLQLLSYALDSLWAQATQGASQCEEVHLACMENVQNIISKAEVLCRVPTAAGGSELEALLQGSNFELEALKKKLSTSLRDMSSELASLLTSSQVPAHKSLKAKVQGLSTRMTGLSSYLEVNFNQKHAEVAQLKNKLLDIWEALAQQTDLHLAPF